MSNQLSFPLNQILMSVPWNPVHVATTLNVPTMTVLTAVLANRDILEMERLVKVNSWLPFYRYKFEYCFISKDAPLNLLLASVTFDCFVNQGNVLSQKKTKLQQRFFYHPQISTSVLWVPAHVMKTLIAPTVTVRTAVLVNKGSLEMVPFVKVYMYELIMLNKLLQQHNPQARLNFLSYDIRYR